MRIDENGTAWWHWLVGALVVTALVVGTVVSAGGLGAGMLALAAAANGVASASIVTTVFAFSAVGAGSVFVASGIAAGLKATETWITDGSFSSGINDIVNYGEIALLNTIGGGISGAYGGYVSYKQQIGTSSQAGYMTDAERRVQREAFWKSQGYPRGRAPEDFEISHIYGTYGNNRNYFIIQRHGDHVEFHLFYGYKINGGHFYRYNPNYINWWTYIWRFFGL